MNLKKIVAAGIAAVCAVSMAACGGSGSGSSKVTDIQYKDIKLGQTGKDIKANLKLFSHRTDMLKNDYPGTTWKQYIAEFNKTYPNIKVTVEANSDYANSAMTRLQGGDWGDIMMIPAVDRAELQNYFISYGSLGDMNKEIKYAVNQSYQKKVYGVASVGNASGIVYNKRIFKEAGIDKLPTTPKEFISDLKAIKEKTKATPLYTNYAAGWTMGAWDAYIGGTATGDPNYMNNVFTHTKNPFKDPGDGTHAYNVYKILYDAVADGLTEDDYSTTDWETSKNKLNSGDIATMVLGSWAVSQIQSAGDNGKDVGYMPFPISVKGKQYATSASDYAYGINKNSSTTNQEAAMIFVKWLTEKSNYAYNEGGVSIAADDDKLPDLYSDFKNVKLIADEPAPDGEEDLFNDLNSDSELNINNGGDSRVQGIVEHAANKDESYNDLVKEWNQKWNDALDSEGVDTK